MPCFSIISKLKKILKKNQNGFRRNQSSKSQGLTIHWIIGVQVKYLKATVPFIDFPKSFDSVDSEETDQIHLAHDLSKETVTSIMKLYKNTKAIVCSPNDDTS